MDVADVNQQRWLWENGQRLENVDQTLLVLSSGKPVPQKCSVIRKIIRASTDIIISWIPS